LGILKQRTYLNYRSIILIGGLISVLTSLVFWITILNKKHKIELNQVDIKTEQVIKTSAVNTVEEITKDRVKKERSSVGEEVNLSLGHHTISI